MVKIKGLKKILIIITTLLILCSISLNTYATSVDNIIKEGSDFLNKGQGDLKITPETLKGTSDLIYNVLLSVSIVAALIMGLIMGIKYMTGSLEEQAKMKESMMPFLVGCIVIFGAFAIWKLAITVFSNFM